MKFRPPRVLLLLPWALFTFIACGGDDGSVPMQSDAMVADQGMLDLGSGGTGGGAGQGGESGQGGEAGSGGVGGAGGAGASGAAGGTGGTGGTGGIGGVGGDDGAHGELPTGPDCESLEPGRRQLRRLSHLEYQNTIRDLLGIQIDANGAFAADVVEHGFDNHPELLDVTGLLAEQYRQMAENLADRAPIADLLPCELAEADIACGHRFIAEFGLKAYRRPLTAQEITGYRELFATVVRQECFEQGIRWVVIAMLQSPHFLYRSELGRGGGGRFTLTPYELASELSYLIWQTTPDAELLELAGNGQLLDPIVLRRQTLRLLAADNSTLMVQNFVGKWLEIENLKLVIRDAVIYAALYFELRDAMLSETNRFVAELWQQDRSFTDFFRAQHSWLNEELSEYYGIPLGDAEPDAAGFHRVPVGGTRPGGILTHGAFLTTHASPTSSSPILRGVTVRERLFCEELALPPAGIPELPEDAGADATTRERFAAHTEDPLCQGCHSLIDPIGFGFEGYDGIGRHRETEGEVPVDVTGAIVHPGGDETAFDGVGELAGLLAQDDTVKACYVRQWLRFGFGEAEGLDVGCYVEALDQHLTSQDGRVRSIVAALTRTPHFRIRTGEPLEEDVIGAELVPSAVGVVPEIENPAIPPVDLENPVCGQPPVMGGGAGVDDPRLRVDVREDRWMEGYCAYYTITNTSDMPINGWRIRVEVDGNINNSWNAERDGDMGVVIFENTQDNAVLDVQQQAQFGFCATL